MDTIYLQTYSLGENMKSDFKGSLKKVAQIGYAGVEFAGGYGDMEAEALKEYLKKLGMKAISSHVALDQVERQLPYLAALGASYVICPGTPMNSYEEVLEKAEKMNALGERAATYGLKFGYHNHYAEFERYQGEYALDLLLKHTDPKYVTLQLDAGWATYAGVDAAEYIRNHAGRIALLHMKEAHNEKSGEGSIDWQAIYQAAQESGVQAYIIEREQDYKGNDIFGCVAEDWEFLRRIQ